MSFGLHLRDRLTSNEEHAVKEKLLYFSGKRPEDPLALPEERCVSTFP